MTDISQNISSRHCRKSYKLPRLICSIPRPSPSHSSEGGFSCFTLLQVVFLAIEQRQSDPRDSDQVFASNFAFFKHKLDALNGCNVGHLLVRVKQECIDFAQFFQYSRVPELTLWRMESADQLSQELK